LELIAFYKLDAISVIQSTDRKTLIRLLTIPTAVTRNVPPLSPGNPFILRSKVKVMRHGFCTFVSASSQRHCVDCLVRCWCVGATATPSKSWSTQR